MLTNSFSEGLPPALESIREGIKLLSEQDRMQVNIAANELRNCIFRHGPPGMIAVALIGAEIEASGSHRKPDNFG